MNCRKSCQPGRPDILRRFAPGLAGLLVLLISTLAARADRNPPNCTGSGLGINLFVSSPGAHIGDTLFYSVTVFNGVSGTGLIACNASSITAFIVTPDGRTNAVPLVRTTLTQGQADTYPDVVSYVVRDQDLSADGTLFATARDIGVIHQNDVVNSSGGGFQGVNTTLIKVQALNCTGSGLGINLFVSSPGAHIGDTLFYSVTVFNGVSGTGLIACDASSITAFIVTPDGRTNAVPIVRTTLTQGQADTYPYVVSYVVRDQDLSADGTLFATARDIGVIHQNDVVNSSGGGFQGVNTTLIKVRALISGSATTTSFNLSFPTENGRSYTIQYKNSPSDQVWTNLRTVTGNGATMSVTDAIQSGRPMRIYRIIYTP